MERTSSQNWFWPEWPCSWIRAAQFSRSGRPKRGSCHGKNVRARIGPFHLNWSEPVLFGRPEQMESNHRHTRTGSYLPIGSSWSMYSTVKASRWLPFLSLASSSALPTNTRVFLSFHVSWIGSYFHATASVSQ